MLMTPAKPSPERFFGLDPARTLDVLSPSNALPPEIPGWPMVLVALLALIANIVVVLLLRSQSNDSLAVKGAYMEVMADAVSSVGVLIAGIVMVTTHWPYADTVVAVLVALWVLPRAIALARAALRILSESSPAHIDVAELRTALTAVDGVTEVGGIGNVQLGAVAVVQGIRVEGDHEARAASSASSGAPRK